MDKKNEFTLDAYQELLKTALTSGYSFLAFHDPERFGIDKVCLLRHDIDADLGAAVELAKIEANLGVRATYFLMLRSPIYNLMGRENTRLAQQVVGLGHWLGLHYDEGFYPDQRYTTEEWIDLEAEILSNVFGQEIKVVSFHQPSEDVLSGKLRLNRFINTYDKNDLPEYFYISDSNMIWKHDPFDVFSHSLHPKLHLLIHPLWWNTTTPNLPTQVVWNNALLSNLYRSQKQILATERAFGNARRFSIVEQV